MRRRWFLVPLVGAFVLMAGLATLGMNSGLFNPDPDRASIHTFAVPADPEQAVAFAEQLWGEDLSPEEKQALREALQQAGE